MDAAELEQAEKSFMERCHRYFENLQTAIHVSA
jgi:hypothetical protein